MVFLRVIELNSDTEHMALLEFYGKECPHCITMRPLVEQLTKELDVEVKQFETWHDPKNEALRKEKDVGGACGGVPFFYNEESGKALCGASSYDELKAWAEGK